MAKNIKYSLFELGMLFFQPSARIKSRDEPTEMKMAQRQPRGHSLSLFENVFQATNVHIYSQSTLGTHRHFSLFLLTLASLSHNVEHLTSASEGQHDICFQAKG